MRARITVHLPGRYYVTIMTLNLQLFVHACRTSSGLPQRKLDARHPPSSFITCAHKNPGHGTQKAPRCSTFLQAVQRQNKQPRKQPRSLYFKRSNYIATNRIWKNCALFEAEKELLTNHYNVEWFNKAPGAYQKSRFNGCGLTKHEVRLKLKELTSQSQYLQSHTYNYRLLQQYNKCMHAFLLHV